MACYSSRGKKKSFILNSVVCHFKKLDIVVQYFACEVADVQFELPLAHAFRINERNGIKISCLHIPVINMHGVFKGISQELYICICISVFDRTGASARSWCEWRGRIERRGLCADLSRINPATPRQSLHCRQSGRQSHGRGLGQNAAW